MTTDLVQFARSLQLDTLDTAWEQAVKSPKLEETSRYATVIDILCDKDLASRALLLATSMIDALASKKHTEAALEFGFRVMRKSAHNDALARTVVGLIDQRYGDQEWLAVLKTRAGLDGGPTVAAILEFDRLRRFTKGHVVYHAAGWGEGAIEDFVATTQEVTVLFATGRRESFPLETLLSRFKALDAQDLRAMKLQRMDVLRQEAERDPSSLLRRTATLYRGTITSQQLKTELCRPWSRRRSGPASGSVPRRPRPRTRGCASRARPRGRPSSCATSRSASSKKPGPRCRTRTTSASASRAARLPDAQPDEEVRTQILALANEVVEQAIEEKKASHAHILDGILFLEENGHRASVPAAQEVRALLVKEDGSLRPSAIDRLATQQSREHAIELLPEALGENWAEQCVVTLPEWPPSVLERVVEKLVAGNHGAQCLVQWDRVAPYTKRHPLLIYLLGKLYCDGIFEGQENCPTALAMGRVLLHLARTLNETRKQNQVSSRLLGRLGSLLSGKRGLLHRACENISREDLAQYLGIVRRAGEDFPQEISDLVDRIVSNKYPDLHAKPEVPYWERDSIFTTREGLRRIKEDYRVLVEDKIPTNSKAIGAAAALGDLSENSEWESAMEEQRNLTGRATDMDQLLRSARLIEDQDVPNDRVAPGVKVTLTQLATGQQLSYRVLGPWDVTDDHTINYLAPIAAGLLGKQVGDIAEMPGTNGAQQVRIDAIERLV